MTKRERAIKDLSEAFSEIIIKTLDSYLRTCLNCDRFNIENEVCNLYIQRPPAKIIAKACERWESIELPF